ncbi:MAG: argininosuccinate lyase [Elusimicrobiota bacterium]|jgi:argininosuccinate lyase|nr:argininosuccinate lyase [Elusimicrobiota bacterium]
MAKTMWGGRFNRDTDKLMEKFNASIAFDKRLFRQDIKGSMAHAKMLAECKIISKKDLALIIKGLSAILKDIEKGKFIFKTELEDIHMNIESELIRRAGDAGKKLHTARSRNDQIAADVHLYLKEECVSLSKPLISLAQTLLDLSNKNKDIIIPAMTHLQHAQPVYFSHHLLAYFSMFERDLQRLKHSFEAADISPLGAGALAGTTFPIDRKMTADLLGFKNIYSNSLDAVSDRDYIVDFLSFCSILIMHLSRFCEELILWQSSEFSFIEIDDAYSTGSSMMPQKKNPDAAELIRGKSGRIFGHLIAILTVMKGLPLAYNKDMQEDKEGLFDAIDNIKMCLSVFDGMIKTLKINESGIKKSFENDFSNATDMADYLVKKGLPFRFAHKICGQAVLLAIKKRTNLIGLDLDDLRKLSPLFEKDIFEKISIKTCVNGRDSYGATSAKQVLFQINKAMENLKNIKNFWIKYYPKSK